MNNTASSPRNPGPTRRESLALLVATPIALFGAVTATALASGERPAGTQQRSAGTPSRGSSSASTVESNKSKRFADIPTDALIGIEELHDLIEDGALEDGTVKVIDIRSHRDYQKIQIGGSRNIPAGRQIEIRIDEIPIDKTVVLIAYKNSDRLAETWFTLIDHGYDPDLVKVADGGVNAWAKAGYPTLKNQFLGC